MGQTRHADPLEVPPAGDAPGARLAAAKALAGTAGERYVERRGIALAVAHSAGVRFDDDWNGRPAVLVGLHDRRGALVAVHGRYLEVRRGQDKMLTVGAPGGVIAMGSGWRAEPLIMVEGLFDALSLSMCGYSAVATIGRRVAWLPAVCAGRTACLAFDNNHPGDDEAQRYAQCLADARLCRLRPPGRCKDWSTALARCGRPAVARWLLGELAAIDTARP